MTRYAGLELDHNAFRIAIFEGSPKKFALVDFIEEPIAADSEVERAELIRGIVSELLVLKENRHLDFVTSMDSRQMVLREIPVPFTRDDQIAKTVRFEAETYLHSLSIEEVIIEYLKCSETETSTRLLICAAAKDRIADHLDGLRELKIDPVVVELDATALATAFANTPMASDDQNVLIVQVDETATRLIFLQHGKVVKIRSLWSRSAASSSSSASSSSDRGGTSVATASPTRLGVDPDESSSESPSGPSGNGVGQTPSDSPPSSDLQDEIARRFEEIERSLEDLDQDDEPAEDVPFVVLNDDDFETLRGREAAEAERREPPEVDIDELVDSSKSAAVEGDSPAEAEAELATGTATLVETGATTDGSADVSAEEAEGVNSAARALARYGSTDPLGRLVLEIERTFAAYLLSNSIDLIVVTGESSERLGVVQRLKDEFEVDVTTFDLGDSFPIEWDGDVDVLSRRGAVACGLGLRALGRGATSFDLRKDEFRFERRFARMVPSLTLLGLLFCALSLVWASREHSQLKSLMQENEVLQVRQAEMTEAFFREPLTSSPQRPDYLAASMRKLDEIKGKKRGGGSRGTIKTYASAMKMFADISGAVDKIRPAVYPKFTSFDLDPELNTTASSTIKFEIETTEDIQRILESLDKNCTLLKVKTSANRQLRDGGYEATVDLNFRAEHVSTPKSKKG